MSNRDRSNKILPFFVLEELVDKFTHFLVPPLVGRSLGRNGSWSSLTEPRIYHPEATGSTGPWSNDREVLICACEITPKLQDWLVRLCLRSSQPEHRPRWSWSLPLRQKQARSPRMGQGHQQEAEQQKEWQRKDCENRN